MSSLALRILEKTISQETIIDERVFVEAEAMSDAVKNVAQEQMLGANVALVTLQSLDVYPLQEGINSIGRDQTCRIRLNDGVVSRQHAQIIVLGEQLLLKDLVSTNGTYVNGQRVKGQIALYGGDRVRIGRNEFVVAA